jgi:hypothetical protein
MSISTVASTVFSGVGSVMVLTTKGLKLYLIDFELLSGIVILGYNYNCIIVFRRRSIRILTVEVMGLYKVFKVPCNENTRYVHCMKLI